MANYYIRNVNLMFIFKIWLFLQFFQGLLGHLGQVYQVNLDWSYFFGGQYGSDELLAHIVCIINQLKLSGFTLSDEGLTCVMHLEVLVHLASSLLNDPLKLLITPQS